MIITTLSGCPVAAVAKHGGKSLNNVIWPVTKLEKDLVNVLTRFHQAPVALSADILELFLQVELQDKFRTWSSNESVVVEDVPQVDRLSALYIRNDELLKTKAVAMWEVDRDIFTFHLQPPDDSSAH